MALALDKRSFLALASIGWADGSLQRVETIGLLRAAKESGLSESDLAEVEAATKTKTSIDDVADLSSLTQWDQVLTYALAAWFAQLDGVLSTSEHTVMVALGNKMGLAEALRKRAQAAAYDIACLPEGGRPDRYDFEKLAARLAERMPQLQRPATTSPPASPSGSPSSPSTSPSSGGETPTTPPGSPTTPPAATTDPPPQE